MCMCMNCVCMHGIYVHTCTCCVCVCMHHVCRPACTCTRMWVCMCGVCTCCKCMRSVHVDVSVHMCICVYRVCVCIGTRCIVYACVVCTCICACAHVFMHACCVCVCALPSVYSHHIFLVQLFFVSKQRGDEGPDAAAEPLGQVPRPPRVLAGPRQSCPLEQKRGQGAETAWAVETLPLFIRQIPKGTLCQLQFTDYITAVSFYVIKLQTECFVSDLSTHRAPKN